MIIDIDDTMGWVRNSLIMVLTLTLAFNHWMHPRVQEMRRERLLANFRAELYREMTGRIVDPSADVFTTLRRLHYEDWQRRELADFEMALREWRRIQFRVELYSGTTTQRYSPSSDHAAMSSLERRPWSKRERELFLAALRPSEQREFLAAGRGHSSPVSDFLSSRDSTSTPSSRASPVGNTSSSNVGNVSRIEWLSASGQLQETASTKIFEEGNQKSTGKANNSTFAESTLYRTEIVDEDNYIWRATRADESTSSRTEIVEEDNLVDTVGTNDWLRSVTV